MTLEVNVNVKVGITPPLEALLSQLLATKEPTQTNHNGLSVRQVIEAIKPLDVEKLEGDPILPAEAPQPQETEPVQEEPPTTVEPLALESITPDEGLFANVPEQEPQPSQETFDDTAMRDIMEQTRVRLIGPSPENKTHPLYKRLNGQFKTEASMVTGGKCDTPTRLPELGPQYCIAFRNACEGLAIDPVSNDIITKAPF